MARLLGGFSKWHRNPSLVRIRRFAEQCAAELPAGSRVLDAGAGDCRYKTIFESHRYEAADFAQVQGKAYGRIDHVCDLRAIPVEDGRYDAVICTQVLAHLPDPLSALREMWRVLRPGGTLWLTCPLFFQENEPPHDFYRYTRHGLRYLFTEAGFEIRNLEEVEGYLGALQYQLGMAAMRLPSRSRDYGGGTLGILAATTAPLWRVLFAAGCQLFTLCELRAGPASPRCGICINYAIVGRRPNSDT